MQERIQNLQDITNKHSPIRNIIQNEKVVVDKENARKQMNLSASRKPNLKKPFKPQKDIRQKLGFDSTSQGKQAKCLFDELPTEVHFRIIQFLQYEETIQLLKPLSSYWWKLTESKLLWNFLNRKLPLPLAYKYRRLKCIVERRSKGRLFQVVSRLTHEPFMYRSIDVKLANANCDDGLPPSLLREISILKTLPSHPYINPLSEVELHASKPIVDLVYEYHPQSLKDLLKQKRPENIDVKIMYQIAMALQFLHSNGLIHRNLKPENILLTAAYQVKLTDFNLSRVISYPLVAYTPEDPKDRERSGRESKRLWYRAPEMLLRKNIYSNEIDIWSFGCVLAEIALSEPLFNGETEIEQLFQVFRLIGSPDENDWKQLNAEYRIIFPRWQQYPLNFKKINDFVSYQRDMYENRQGSFNKLRKLNQALGEAGMDLLERCLTLQAQNRPSLKEIMNHRFFKEIKLTVPYYINNPIQKMEVKQYLPEFQPNLTPLMRGILVDWLIDVATHFDLQDETLQLAVTYVDLTLSKLVIEKNKLQLVGVSSIKMADVYHERSKEYYKQENCNEYAYITADEYTPQQLISMEKIILKQLGFRLTYMTTMHYVKIFTSQMPEHIIMISKSQFFADFFLQFHSQIILDREILAWAVIYLAFKVSETPFNQNLKAQGVKIAFDEFVKTLNELKKMHIEWKNHPQMHAFEAVHQKYQAIQTRTFQIQQINQVEALKFYEILYKK